MEWFLGFYIFVCVVLIVGLYYATSEKIVGSEAARRNSRLFPWLLFGLVLALILAFPGGKALAIVNMANAVLGSTYLVVWSFSKQEAGVLLAKIERTSLRKLFIFLLCLIVFAFAIYLTWRFSTLVSNGIPKYTSLELEISQLILVWVVFITCIISTGSNKLEFRENGIYFGVWLIKWQRINSYTLEWEPLKQNVLTIQFKPGFPLLLESMSMGISEKHIEIVSHILGERLPEKSL